MKAVAAAVALAFATSATAGVVLTIEEVNGDVFLSGGGTLDTSLWGTGPVIGGGEGRIIAESTATVGPNAPLDLYLNPSGFTGPSSIGPGMSSFIQNSATGDTFGLQWNIQNPVLLVPRDYVSGELLTGSATFAGESFASIGLTLGSYTWMWKTETGSDFFQVNVVPAPSALVLFGIAGVMRRRRRR